MTALFKINRRKVLQTGGAMLAASLTGAGFSAFPAVAAKKSKKKQLRNSQAPGFFRFRLGEYTVTMVSDGGLVIPASSFGGNVPEAQVKAFLKSNLADTENYYAHTNTCLIDTGKKVVLIDAGAGDQFQKTAGRVVANVMAAGYDVKDIDSVILTHAHPDHAWGIWNGKRKKPIFPNADYYVNSKEWDYWTQEDIETKAPQAIKAMALMTKKTLIPVAAKTMRIKPGHEILPGFECINTEGHTVGHISLAVTSQKETLIISGDVVHHAFVSFEHPEWHFAFDMDPEKAVASRKALLERAANDKVLFAGFHLPFPGIGRVTRKGKAFRWVPETWRWEL